MGVVKAIVNVAVSGLIEKVYLLVGQRLNCAEVVPQVGHRGALGVQEEIQPLIFEGRVQQLPLGLIPGVGGLVELPIEIADKTFGGGLFVTYHRLQSLYFPFQTKLKLIGCCRSFRGVLRWGFLEVINFLPRKIFPQPIQGVLQLGAILTLEGHLRITTNRWFARNLPVARNLITAGCWLLLTLRVFREDLHRVQQLLGNFVQLLVH